MSCGKKDSTEKISEKEPAKQEHVSDVKAKEEKVAKRPTVDDPVEELISYIDSGDLTIRKEAVDAIRGKGRFAVDPLIDTIVNDSSSSVAKINAAKLLDDADPNWINKESAAKTVPFFIQMLVVPEEDLREMAQVVLELIGEPAMKELIVALRGDDILIAEFSSSLLMRIDMYWLRTELGKRAVPDFVKALKDERANVKANATVALVNMGHYALDHLIYALLDEDWEFQKRAFWILNKIDPEWGVNYAAVQAVPDFIDALKSDKEGVRLSAVVALSAINDKRAIEPLIAVLNDDFYYAKSRAQKALEKLTGENFGMDQGKWVSWWKDNKKDIMNKKE